MSVVIYFKNSTRVFFEGVTHIANLSVSQSLLISYYKNGHSVQREYDTRDIVNITIDSFESEEERIWD